MRARKGFMEGRIKEAIAKSGRLLLGVFPDEASTDPVNDSFTYTIGNTEVGLPELVVLGDHQASYLNELSQMMIDRGAPFGDGEMVNLGGEHSVRVHRVARTEPLATNVMVQADFYYKGKYDAMQVVLPDKEGRFPEDSQCDEPYALVSRYYEPAVSAALQ